MEEIGNIEYMKKTVILRPYLLLSIFLLLILASCKEENRTSKNIQISSIDTTAISIEDSVKIDFPIDRIISNSRKRKRMYEIGHYSIPDLNEIPKEILTEYLMPFPIVNYDNYNIEYDEYSRYYFFDYAKFEDFILFTIIKSDESGYDHFYSYIYDIKKGVICDVVAIAAVGVDGGHSQSVTLSYSQSMDELKVTTKSAYDEDLFEEGFENCYTRIFTNYESSFNFQLANTRFAKKELATTVDTICSKE